VTLSFWLNATDGFHGKDTFAVLVSDIDSNRTMVMSNLGGIFENYESAISITASTGLMEFDLSREWGREFSSPLPDVLVLTFAVYDFDGIMNAAYIDDIKLATVSLS
jgi:hypothetical protein